MLFNFYLLTVISLLPIYSSTIQEVVFTAHNTYKDIDSFKLVDNLIILNELPLISCLFKCMFSERCSKVFYRKSRACILILDSEEKNRRDRTNFILYLIKNNNLIFNESTVPNSKQENTTKDNSTEGENRHDHSENDHMDPNSKENGKSAEEMGDRPLADFRSAEIEYTCTEEGCECLDQSKIYSKQRSECVKCRDGWKKYKNVCFLETTLLLNWTDYKLYCGSLDSSLVILDDRDKFEYFQQIAIKYASITGYLRTWVGAVYNSTYNYKWLNGQEMDLSFFSPVNNNNLNNCVAYFTIPNCLLQTLVCWTRSHGICEYQL